MSNLFSESDQIRENKLNLGINSLKSRIKDVEYEVSRPIKENVEVERKYTEIEVADTMYQMYKSRVAPTIKEDEPLVVANTHAMKVNAKALMKSLAGYRNTGNAGPHTHFTHQCNGDVGVHTGNYGAMIVAGTEMTLEETEPETIDEFRERIDGIMEACWKGYKQKGNKKMFGKEYPNCVKEEELDVDTKTVDEQMTGFGKRLDTYYHYDMEDAGKKPSDIKKRSIKGKKPAGVMVRGVKEEVQETDYLIVEEDSEAVKELKDKLMEMDDHSWQSIDKVMRVIAKEHKITPKQLHKDFKAENDGQIPDEWIKENRVMEEAGWMPLEEAVAINEIGNVYEVTGMWHAHTRRIKFFVPTVGIPTKDEIQYYFEMFFPGGKVISHYPSMHPGDNIKNEMVVVVPMKEEWVELEQQSWLEMSDTECGIYEYILSEEGEPTSPPMMHEDGSVEVWVEDHETGEERQIFFSEKEGKKDACYNKVKSRYKVWPSAYASGALVKCRKAGASNWGNSTKKEEFEYMEEGTPAWQRKEGKNPSGGLNAKGVASYRAANPGSKLKTAVTTKPSKLKKGSKAANRRKSFCARMSGMKKRLTSAKTARDPDSRINKSLRKWNC
jgi:hypothetical protein